LSTVLIKTLSPSLGSFATCFQCGEPNILDIDSYCSNCRTEKVLSVSVCSDCSSFLPTICKMCKSVAEVNRDSVCHSCRISAKFRVQDTPNSIRLSKCTRCDLRASLNKDGICSVCFMKESAYSDPYIEGTYCPCGDAISKGHLLCKKCTLKVRTCKHDGCNTIFLPKVSRQLHCPEHTNKCTKCSTEIYSDEQLCSGCANDNDFGLNTVRLNI